MEGFVSKTTNSLSKIHDELKDNSILLSLILCGGSTSGERSK